MGGYGDMSPQYLERGNDVGFVPPIAGQVFHVTDAGAFVINDCRPNAELKTHANVISSVLAFLLCFISVSSAP